MRFIIYLCKVYNQDFLLMNVSIRNRFIPDLFLLDTVSRGVNIYSDIYEALEFYICNISHIS